MNPPLDPTHALVAEALRLPERERAALAADLLASLPPPPGILREDEAGFADEVNRRAERVDPVLEALKRAPLDDFPESEEEREAVAKAKASRQMKPHAVVEDALEARPAAE